MRLTLHRSSVWKALSQLKILRDESGQDLVEYSLMTAAVAVAAAALVPYAAVPSMYTIYSKLNSSLIAAAR